MKLSENDIKYIIKETTSIISERRGILGGKYEELADEILGKIDEGETFFDIDMPDGNFIVVTVKEEDGSNMISDKEYTMASKCAEANPYTRTLTIWKTESTLKNMKSKIMHELTHFKNSEKSELKPNVIMKHRAFEIFNAASYLFQDTEMNARLTEFYYWLKSGHMVNKITEANDVLYVYQMWYILNQIYEDYYDIEKNGGVSLVQWLTFLNNRTRVDDSGYPKYMNFHDYKKSKDSLYKKYYKKYQTFCNKAFKILGTFKQENNGGH